MITDNQDGKLVIQLTKDEARMLLYVLLEEPHHNKSKTEELKDDLIDALEAHGG